MSIPAPLLCNQCDEARPAVELGLCAECLEAAQALGFDSEDMARRQGLPLPPFPPPPRRR